MKNLIISIILSVFLYSCINSIYDENIPNPIVKKDSLSVFKDIQLPKDSMNISLKMGDKLKIPLINDSLEIEILEISQFCLFGETSCDVSSTVKLRLIKNKINYTLPEFDLGWGAGTQKRIYFTPSCNLEEVNYFNHFVVFNKLIYVIKELTPYPKTRAEVNDLKEKKLYCVNLTILNKCTK